MDPSSKSQDEYCIIQPGTILALDNVDQHAAAGNLKVDPVYERPPPSSNHTIVVQVA